MGLTVEQITAIDGVNSVEEILDETGQKQVFIASTPSGLTAIKVLHIAQGGVVFEGKLRRIEREIDLIDRINSEYTPKLGPISPRVIKIGRDFYLVYSEQYIPGKDVSELIQEGYYDSEAKLKQLIHDVTQAIKAYWFDANETVHRDIKPQNIRLNSDTGKYVLIDAGIAYVRNKTNFTPTGFRSPGTPGFISPEHMVPGMEFSYRTDLYSLGVVAYIAATGIHPTDDYTLDNDENDRRVVTHIPENPRQLRQDILSEELASTIIKLLAKQAHMRPRKLETIISATEDF